MVCSRMVNDHAISANAFRGYAEIPNSEVRSRRAVCFQACSHGTSTNSVSVYYDTAKVLMMLPPEADSHVMQYFWYVDQESYGKVFYITNFNCSASRARLFNQDSGFREARMTYSILLRTANGNLPGPQTQGSLSIFGICPIAPY